MNETSPTPPPKIEPQRPSLTCDWQEWAEYLDHFDASDTTKREMIETIWAIVVTFVDLGWDVDPGKNCGQTLDLNAALAKAVLNSTEKKEERV